VKLEEFAPSSNDKEQLNEIIPALIIGGGLLYSAYDAWKMKKAYDRGEISGSDMAKAVGWDVALTLAGGAVGKVAGKGWKYGKKIYKDKKSAKKAERDDIKKTVKAKKVKPLTKKERKELDNLNKKAMAARRKALGIKTDSKLKKTGRIARKIVAPFGSNAPKVTRAEKKIRKKHEKKQAEVAKQRELDNAPMMRDKLEKARADAKLTPKQKAAELEAANIARAEARAAREAARKAENKRQADALRAVPAKERISSRVTQANPRTTSAKDSVIARVNYYRPKTTAGPKDLNPVSKTSKTSKTIPTTRPSRTSGSGYKSINSLQKQAEKAYHAGKKLDDIVAAGPKVK
jgi:hypothetical protein